MQPHELHEKFRRDFGSTVSTCDETAHLAFLDECQDAGLDLDCAGALRECVRAYWRTDAEKPDALRPPQYAFLNLLAKLEGSSPGWEWHGLPRASLQGLWINLCKADEESGRFDLVLTLEETGWATDLHYLVRCEPWQRDRFLVYKRRPKEGGRYGRHRRVAPVNDIMGRFRIGDYPTTPAVVVGFRQWKGGDARRNVLLHDPSTGRFAVVSDLYAAYCLMIRPKARFHLPTGGPHSRALALVETFPARDVDPQAPEGVPARELVGLLQPLACSPD